MDDAEFVFVTDIAQKKKTGRGAFNKVRGGGRYVRLPSDNLSYKERQKMNGEVTSYRLNEPVDWTEFKRFPDDIQVEYIKGLQRKYNAPAKFVSAMLGVHQTTLSGWSRKHGVAWKARGKDSKFPVDQWEAFLKGNAKPEAPVADVPAVEYVPGANTTAFVNIPKEQELTLQADKTNIAAVLAMLIGTGAKLTIEVTL